MAKSRNPKVEADAENRKRVYRRMAAMRLATNLVIQVGWLSKPSSIAKKTGPGCEQHGRKTR